MKSLQLYSIPFTGLKLGTHEFEYAINEAFFNEFEYSLIKSGNVKVDLKLEKQETMLLLDFRITGEIKLSCDVCLADYPYPVDITEREIVKFSGDGEEANETDEIIVLARHETEISIAPLIYEYTNLAVPYINRCNDEGNTEWCDQEMIGKLKELSGGANSEDEESTDPRWEALKNIKK